MSTMNAITLMTDFGTVDGYVGAMKGVLAAHTTQIIDISHVIPAQNIIAGAFCWSRAWPYFPTGTVHLGVIDPGVGSDRNILIAHCQGHHFVAPDNGLIPLALALSDADDVEYRHLKVAHIPPAFASGTRSHTFHGRDLMAPTAAALASGISASELGNNTQHTVQIPVAENTHEADAVNGVICAIDHFGNAISSVRGAELHKQRRYSCIVRGEIISTVHTHYAAVREGEPVALIGSDGFCEIAVRNGNAAEKYGISIGDPIQIRLQAV